MNIYRNITSYHAKRSAHKKKKKKRKEKKRKKRISSPVPQRETRQLLHGFMSTLI